MARSERRPGRFWRLVRTLFILFVCLAGLGAGLVTALVVAYSRDLPDVEALRHYQPSATTHVYAANGELIATLFRENRTWISIKDVPACFKKAIVASEDSRFYEHYGVDPVGIARVLWWVVRRKGLSQGASTITMQLARNVFLNDEVTVKRKIQEMLVAVELERRYSKDELLEFYLNQIYFGSGAYGLEAAAETYFDKKAARLDLAESALIVGVVPAPSDYSPFVNPKLAKDRQTLVLRRMVEVGAITQAEAKAALAEKLVYARARKDPFVLKYPYFTTYVLRKLARQYGEEVLYRGGLKVYTTLDPAMQAAAQDAVDDGVRAASAQHVSEGALVAIEPRTGYVKAMVGGTGYSTSSQFNRGWQMMRPAGSSFKIFVYTCALENGFSPDTIVADTPVALHPGPGQTWSPRNSDGRYMGMIPLRTALQHSRNPVSARLVDQLTPPRVVDLAYKMGIRSHVDAVLSIALGSCAVSPFDMASALATLANGGRRAEPTAIKLVEDGDGKVVEDHRHPTSDAVVTARSALAMTEMMTRVVEAGTGYAARLADRPAAGKTGTTDEHRDAWFCGFVPQLAAAVWVGNDDDSDMRGTYGGDVPAPIWKRFMEAALRGKPVEHFGADPEGMVAVDICRQSGQRATSLCPDVEHRTYRWDAVPQRFCTAHVNGPSGRDASPVATPTAVDETPDPAPSDDGDAPPPPAATPEGPAGSEEDPTAVEAPSPVEATPIEPGPAPTENAPPPER
jgi:penicillin-binding protein 1A